MNKKHLPLFEVLTESTELQRRALLKTLTDVQLRAILEAVYNVLQGSCPLQSKDKKKLFEHRAIIRRMVSKQHTDKQQKRLLNKYHDIIPLLLKPVLKALKW